MNYELITRRSVLISTCIASFLTPFLGSAIIISLPKIGIEFNLNTLDLNWIVTSYMISTAAFLVPMGHLSDVLSRKKIFLLGMFLSSIISLFCAFAFNGPSLITLRAIHGLATAMTFSSAIPLLISVYPNKERGKILGINVSFVYLGLTLGPTTGGFLTHNFDWRWLFYLISGLGFVSCFLIKSKLSEITEVPTKSVFDLKGSMLYTVSIGFALYSISTIKTFSYSKIIFPVSLILIIIFVILQFKNKRTILNLNLFRNMTFAYSNVAALIHYCALSALTFLLSIYLQFIKNFSPQKAGLILLIQPVLMAILSPRAGKLSDKIEPRILVSLGMILTFIGILFFSFLSEATTLTSISSGLIIIGIGFGLFSSPNTNAIMSSVDKQFYGTASSILGTMRILGQTISMSLVTFFFSFYLLNVPIATAPHDLLLKGIRISFITFTILCFAGIFISLLRGKIHNSS